MVKSSEAASLQRAVLLRGINVGGRHPVPMAVLRALFVELGCTDVETYIQSGNLICTSPVELTPRTIESALQERFGFAIPIAMRTLAELDAIVAANPFAAAGANVDLLHAAFLEAPLASALLTKLETKRTGEEQLASHGRELFLLLPHGFGRSRLAAACTGTAISGNPTVRNWKTVLELQRMLHG